ncbi:helix-turn-helix domain-containing protein [Streptomyces hydrogenans]|uniref:helix-turn-helix domain-containing protein n=1 Tax=Streptomyces hydrogenans TaxID=1873719 RepID=UPI00382D654B
MEHEDESSAAPVATVARRVREVRKRRDLTADQLAERLRGIGLPWERGTVIKLESGYRQNVGVAELLALAVALDVSPLHLLVPVDNRPYRVTPDRTEDSNTVRAWVRGEHALPGMDTHAYETEVAVQDMQWRISGRPRGHLVERGEAEEREAHEAMARQLETMAQTLRRGF